MSDHDGLESVITIGWNTQPMSVTIGHLAGKVGQRRCFTPRAIGAANIRRGIFRTSPVNAHLSISRLIARWR
ncbi:hypothetical protein, partial [Bradyrhizobium retamae]|uniref:hypothetical protein n=1 Tax=Bradyrhizobium retamae TaxID=1300035 RepID=UPI000AFF732F